MHSDIYIYAIYIYIYVYIYSMTTSRMDLMTGIYT